MHLTTIRFKLTGLLLVVVLLAACGPSVQQTPTSDPNTVLTEAVLTVAVRLTQSAALTPSPVTTQPQEAPTEAPVLPTEPVEEPPAPPVATATFTPAPQPTTGSANSPDGASFVEDVTVPDGTGAAPGAVFEKIWRIKNTGTTTWSSAYALVWIEGEKMGSPDSIPMPKEVRPGETVDIAVTLTAPTKPGAYQTFYRLRNANGQFFRLDGSGDIWIKINVGTGPTQTLEPSETPSTEPTSS
jgi:hypothetical protein